MATSLYRCPGSCGEVLRGESGHAYGCMCDALPLGNDRMETDGYNHFAAPFGAGQIGPPRPYFHDREHRMIEFEDDGREVTSDLREGIWLA
jgi:hypothetical protein